MPTKEEVVAALKEIIDPHTNISIYDMGLISDLKVTRTEVSLTFRPTSPWCPLGPQLAMNIKRRLEGLKGTKKTKVKVVGHVYMDAINKSISET